MKKSVKNIAVILAALSLSSAFAATVSAKDIFVGPTTKAEKAVEALQKMSAATTKVLRDGKVETVKSEDLVVGDVILLDAGDAIPADCRLFECASMKIEEAALTGESVPVTKLVNALMGKSDDKEIALGDRQNMAYMGSTLVYGRGKAVVVAFAAISFLMYDLISVKNGLITFKAAVLLLTAVLAAVPLSLEWLDAQKMKKTIYSKSF